MPSKHQNIDDDYIVIGGKRRWFGTPMSPDELPTKQDAYSEQTFATKKSIVVRQVAGLGS